MPISSQAPLASFHHFISQYLAEHEAGSLSPDQALQRWKEHEATLAAIQSGLDDIHSGRVRPANEVLTELRKQLEDE